MEAEEPFRDIYALTAPERRRDTWETSSQRSSSVSVASSENFTSMSREFNALVLAGSGIGDSNRNNSGMADGAETGGGNNHLGSIGEEDIDRDHLPEEEANPLAVVPDSNPNQEQMISHGSAASAHIEEVSSVERVKKEEVESKINAWQNAKISKINNRFKREDAIINGWESEQVQKASSWMKKVERKLEERRARAMEKMQNDIAKAHRKAEERRASSEAKRGTKVAGVLQVANLMRAVGRAPSRKPFF
ncbi:hypothetical protein SAY87_008411 [Trapa incisa]|uniref:Remorin C-terminal domain-containing protein n=2 Tax=Trapa TaxID=22665 RepID=A0AAN7L3G7_TRANT|nr:hypothetical protein SAY87_008411 [Trapa incisa]KAK4777054.1 hypothetical protein SAY86_005742 [Trapa natans]